MFYDSYTEAKGRFYEHFMSKMKRIAGLIESSYIRALDEFERDRPNFEFAIDISLLPEYFSVPGGYNEITWIVSLFNAVLAEEKKIEVFHSWAEMCQNDGKLGVQIFFLNLVRTYNLYCSTIIILNRIIITVNSL